MRHVTAGGVKDSTRDNSAASSRRLRVVKRVALGLLGLYVFAVALLVAGQERVAFPGWTIRKPWIGYPPKSSVEEVMVHTSDGNTIQAWWLPPPATVMRQGMVTA